jgi:putative sigma-54 modulation protein
VQIKVSARHGQLGDELHKQVQDKAEKLLHYFDRVTLIEVTLDLRGEEKKAEILLNAEHKHDFVARGMAADPLHAVMAAVDRMKQQIKHYKEKLQDHRRDPSHNGGPTP